MKIFVSILLLASFTGIAHSKTVVWKLNNINKIGGHQTTVLGEPKGIETDEGKAIWFDGFDDGIFIETNPLHGAKAFTVEAIFRPDSNGPAEQRWLHIEDLENVESRVMLETRVIGSSWFLDTFLKSGEARMPLFAENFKHQTDRWYHVALVYNGSEMRHYIDGKLEMSGKIVFKPMGKGRVSIGVRQNKVYWYKGAVRMVSFASKALEPNKFKLL